MSELKNWLIEQIAEESGESANDNLLNKPFDDMDLDSISLLSVAYELEAKIGQEIDPTIFTEYNTINELLKWIESQQ